MPIIQKRFQNRRTAFDVLSLGYGRVYANMEDFDKMIICKKARSTHPFGKHRISRYKCSARALCRDKEIMFSIINASHKQIDESFR